MSLPGLCCLRPLLLSRSGFTGAFSFSGHRPRGEKCSLREGKVLGERYEPLLRLGDLLVTTGLDGIFPADLLVGTVTKIQPLCEGGSSYSLEAEPACVDFYRISEVFVLPPQ